MKVGKQMKKSLVKLVTLMSTVVLVAACGDSSNNTESTTETTDESSTEETANGLPAYGDFEDTVELELSGAFTKGNVVDDNWVQEKLEEQFNVDITNVKTDTWDSQETSILVASNELPDTFAFTSGGMTPLEFYQDGLTRSIPREMIETYAPNYAAMLDEVDDGVGWNLNQSPDNPDEYLSLVGYQGHADGIIWASTLRLDWLENLGFEIPEDAEPIGDSDGYERIYMTNRSYTIEELEEILTAFTFDDPDGNGQDDTYGLMPFNNNMNWALTLLGAYGVTPGYNLIENGELKHSVIADGYKEALIQFADWYEKGIIDPEWTTLDERTAWEKYRTGKTGYYIAQRTYLAQEAWTEGRAPHNILGADPDAKLLVINHEVGPNGHAGQPSYMPVTLLGDNMHIAAHVTDEQLVRYLQMFDFMHHSSESVWTKYGNPGEHSDWMGEEGNSTLITRPEYDIEEGETGFWAYSHRSYYGDHLTWLNHVKTAELMEKFFAKPEIVEQFAIRPVRYDLFNETEQSELESRYQAQLDTLVQEFRINGITGKIDIEAEWDGYVENYMNNGGSQLLEELEKAPLVSDLIGWKEAEDISSEVDTTETSDSTDDAEEETVEDTEE